MHDEEIAIKDLLLVTYLYHKKVPFSRPPAKISPKTVTFFFIKTKEVEKLCVEFIGSEASALLSSYRDIKEMAFDIKREAY